MDTNNRWSNLGLFEGLSGDSSTDYSPIIFPVIRRLEAKLLGGNTWVKSEKQQLKENRINKLRKVQGKDPNVILPNDEYIGLVSVKPLCAPSSRLFYIDYKYETIKDKRKKKLNQLNNIIRIDKLKYIEEKILKNN